MTSSKNLDILQSTLINDSAKDLHSALVRLYVGVTQQNLPNCDYYTGILADAIEETKTVLDKCTVESL